MLLTKAVKRNIALYVAAFFLCGVFHVLLYGKDFAFCFSQIFCSVLTILWAVTVRKRITDCRLRALMLWIAVFLLLLFVLQISRYELFYDDKTTQRYLWYAFYIPMTAQPLLFFFIAVLIYRLQDRPLPGKYYLLIAVGALLVLGVLTNDLHFWFKSFPSGIMDDNGQEKSGPLYYIINVFIYGLYALAFAVIQKKNHRYVARRYRWIVALPLMIGLTYFLLYPIDIGHRLFRTRFWQMGEMLGFCTIAALESCIQTGMIPANRGYEKLFSAADLPAVILNIAGEPVYQTAAAQYPFTENESTRLVAHPIQGGRVEYLVDIEQVKELNREIGEATQQIESRNAYIAEETRIKQERAELETRNRLYERVSDIVKPQLEQIEEILNATEGCGRKELSRIAVLQTYIKRRSNMELLAAAGTLTVVELSSAVSESMDYVRLCGVNTASGSVGTGSYPADMIIAAYEQIEEITEASLDTLTDMIVNVRSDNQCLIVRMMLKAENFSYEANGTWQDTGFSRKVSITKENQDMIIVLTFSEGGGRT